MSEYQRIHLNKGFTIIELILALLIITLVIVGVLMFFPTSRRATEESALKTRIANSVVSEIEVAKAKGYKGLKGLLEDKSKLKVELDLKGDIVRVYYDDTLTENPDLSKINTTLDINSWKSSLSSLGVEKGIIEIKLVSGVENFLSVRVRAEWGSGKNYEITTYISL
jgi:type II secretory pathway pseudopilin PulG